MKAARINEYGGAEKVIIEEIQKPSLEDKQILVEVHTSSINPFDTTVREGRVPNLIKQLPITLGGDIAGVVADAGTSELKVGDKIYGQANVVAGNSGAFAEFATTSADEVALVPEKLNFIEAGSLPLVGVAALQGIKGFGLKKDQKILIHGGSGGIGSIAIQIAKHLGAYVATTASGNGSDYVSKLGADKVIDYKNQKFEEVLSDFDAVFDTVSGETYNRSFQVLKRGGKIISMLSAPNEELMKKYGVEAIAQQTRVSKEMLDELSELIKKNVVTPHVGKVFSLDQIQEAFRAREGGGVLGKVVIKIK